MERGKIKEKDRPHFFLAGLFPLYATECGESTQLKRQPIFIPHSTTAGRGCQGVGVGVENGTVSTLWPGSGHTAASVQIYTLKYFNPNQPRFLVLSLCVHILSGPKCGRIANFRVASINVAKMVVKNAKIINPCPQSEGGGGNL